MTRRIVRTGIQLGLLTGIVLLLIFLLDARYRVLPQSIHNHIPSHHPGLVITDIQVQTCSSVNPLSKCRLNPDRWHRIEKDLYLNKGWISKAYVHIRRRREEELTPEDKVILDVRIGRLDPAVGEQAQANEKWENRPGGIWLKRSAKQHAADNKMAVTAVDILFGPDAVEPRPGWEVLDHALFLENAGEAEHPRLSIRRGTPHKIDKIQPRINKDGKFKIMQVSDLHLSTGLGHCRDPMPAGHNGGKCDADPRTLEFVGRMLDQEKPDLVVLSGDQVNGDTAPDTQSPIFKFAELFIKRNIPYATIYGNHDDEGSLNRAAMMDLTSSLPLSLGEAGPAEIAGVGNYHLEVLAPHGSSHSALTIYFFDTHKYSPNERQYPGYDWVKENQIAWFKDTARRLKDEHKHYTHIHMDMAFIHIPLPEYRDPENEIHGTWTEPPTAPNYNTHLKDALVEHGISVVSCGHDHVNDYCAMSRSKEDKKPEIWMCYAGGSGFGGYGGWGGYHRRIRVFEIDANDASIRTWKRLEWPDMQERVDEQTIVSDGKVTSRS